MTKRKAELLLLLCAIIWGFAFVAQRKGMESIGPLSFSALRFAAGGLLVLPVWLLRHHLAGLRTLAPADPWPLRRSLLAILILGLVLFTTVNLQQIGLVYTTASKAGFITSLYVVLVPLAGLVHSKKIHWPLAVGAILALAGLYLVNIGPQGLAINVGDVLVLGCALAATAHILLLARLGGHIHPLSLALGQVVVCAVLSLVAALLFEPEPFRGIAGALWPLIYGATLSIALSYTLQIVAQKFAPPGPAAIIMSLEALVAALGGVLVLGEALGAGLAIGGCLMLAGLVLVQWQPWQHGKSPAN